MQIESWLAFCSIALLATATPGPAALLVSVNSITYGFSKSMATIMGNVIGLFVMSSFSILGLSMVVMHSAVVFTIIKVLGALYLISMGINLWRNGLGKNKPNHSQSASKSTARLFVQGLLIALTNPKAIVFTTALFPQFITLSDPLAPQFSVLVLSFMLLSFVCLSTYAFLAQTSRLETLVTCSNKLLGKIFGTSFIGAGCFLMSTSR